MRGLSRSARPAAQDHPSWRVLPIRAIVVLARHLAAGPAGDVELGVDQLRTCIGFVERHEFIHIRSALAGRTNEDLSQQ